MKQQRPLIQLNNNNIIKEDDGFSLLKKSSNIKNNRLTRFFRNQITKLPKRIITKTSTSNTKSKVSHNDNSNKRRSTSVSYRTMLLVFVSLAVSLIVKPAIALAMGGMGGASKGPVAPIQRKEALSLFGLFFGLFGGLALLHAAEIAITTLYPWKVREFAEEVRFSCQCVCVCVCVCVLMYQTPYHNILLDFV
jgi:hypothetical protein